MILRAYGVSAPAVTSMMGVRSIIAEYWLQTIRLIVTLAGLSEDHLHRRALQEAIARHDGDPLELSWTRTALALIKKLDDLEAEVSAGTDCPYHTTGTQWMSALRQALDDNAHCTTRAEGVLKMRKHMAYVVEWMDWKRNQDEINSKRYEHLWEVRHLLSAATGMLPFLEQRRGPAHVMRVRVRNGIAGILGYKHRTGECPWCLTHTVSIAHLLRDCTGWAPHRERMRQQVKAIGVQFEMMSADVATGVEVDTANFESDQWYRLMVGASVDDSFLDSRVFKRQAVGVDRETKERRRLASTSSATAEREKGYCKMLDVCGQLLVQIVSATQEAFGVEGTLIGSY